MQHLNHLKRKLPCDWLTSALDSKKKNKNQLERIAYSFVSPRYLAFDSIILNHKLKPEKTKFKKIGDLLLNYYNNSPTKLQKKLKERRDKHELTECPYCGNPVIPDTLDHFLPKDYWPDFSIYPNNLVPQCRGCAPIKGKRYYDDISSCTLFLHPMYEEIISKTGFKIKTSIVKKRPHFKVTFKLKGNNSQEEKMRLKIHIKSLKIVSRVEKYCHQQYVIWKNNVKKNGFNVKNSLTIRMGEIADQQIFENWKIAFLQSILENKDAIDHLQSYAPKLINKSIELVEDFEVT